MSDLNEKKASPLQTAKMVDTDVQKSIDSRSPITARRLFHNDSSDINDGSVCSGRVLEVCPPPLGTVSGACLCELVAHKAALFHRAFLVPTGKGGLMPIVQICAVIYI